MLLLAGCDEEKTLPACLQEKIKGIQEEYVWNPPASVCRITTTLNKVYYYIPQHCCDFFSELYDEQCNLICNPDGGITGNGSGDCPPYEIKTKELVWKDPRGK
jgi:hypothetical protein